jgi:putative redox protein
MKKTITFCEIHSHGFRREEHPTGFKKVIVDLSIGSPDVTDSDMAKVIKLSEDTYCPVWSMLKGNVDIEIRYVIK